MTTVLVVENNRMIRTMYAAGLAGYGYDVIEAQSVREAEQLLATGLKPHIVLLDMRLPDGDGNQVIQAVERHANRSLVRIIVATGMPLSTADMLQLRADTVLQKPVGIIELLGALQPTR